MPPKEEDMRGLGIAEEILVGGRIERVRPPTPEEERESIYDFSSEGD